MENRKSSKGRGSSGCRAGESIRRVGKFSLCKREELREGVFEQEGDMKGAEKGSQEESPNELRAWSRGSVEKSLADMPLERRAKELKGQTVRNASRASTGRSILN